MQPLKQFIIFLCAVTVFSLVNKCKPIPEENECNFDPDSVSIFEISDPISGDTVRLSDFKFEVHGKSQGILEQENVKIYLLVYPVNPPGNGWYIQDTEAQIDRTTGDWFAIGQLGSDSYFPKTDDKFDIKAIVTEDNNKLLTSSILSVQRTSELRCGYKETLPQHLICKTN